MSVKENDKILEKETKQSKIGEKIFLKTKSQNSVYLKRELSKNEMFHNSW